jgi:membrane protein implicated in regulation of membrane protease activity
MTDVNLKFVALVFGIIFLVVLLVRRAVKKVNKERQENKGRIYKKEPSPVKPDLSEEQFNRSWKSLSYLLLLAAAGSLYMVYNGIRSALAADLTAWQILFWIDAILSLAAAAAAVVVWQTRSKLWVMCTFS